MERAGEVGGGAGAEAFVEQFYCEHPDLDGRATRLAQVRAEISATGSYRHTRAELVHGARMAWRNAPKCIGRLYWRSLTVLDRWHVRTADDIFTHLVLHLRRANGGTGSRAARPVPPRPRGLDLDRRRRRHQQCGVRPVLPGGGPAPEPVPRPGRADAGPYRAPRDPSTSAIVTAVQSLDDPLRLDDYLRGLGRDHRKFGTEPAHYTLVGDALVDALREHAGQRWSHQYEQAWRDAYGVIAQRMQAGAAGDPNPPWWEAEVVAHERRAKDIAVLTVTPSGRIPYLPGQYVSVETPIRPRLWRTYSVANAPRPDHTLDLHVRALSGGWVSGALVRRTAPGSRLRVAAPMGSMMLDPASERDLVCVVGGTACHPAGGRGLSADLLTLAALGCQAAPVVAAVVTTGPDFHPLPIPVVRAQLDAALADDLAAVKVGAVVDAGIVGMLTAAARAGRLPNLVVDPVLATLPGRRRGLADGYRRLLAYATVTTPDADEAAVLADWPMTAPSDLAGAAGQIAASGVPVVVVTGGSLPGDDVVGMVWVGTGVRALHGRRIPGPAVPGTGSTFATAVAAQLAHGVAPGLAVEYAKRYTSRAISGAAGIGALDHFEATP